MLTESTSSPDAHEVITREAIQGIEKQGALYRQSQAGELVLRGLHVTGLLTLLPLLNTYLPQILGPEQKGPVRIIENPYFSISNIDYAWTALGLVVAKYLLKKSQLTSEFKYGNRRVIDVHPILGHELIAFSDATESEKGPDTPLDAVLIRLPRYVHDNVIAGGQEPFDELRDQLFQAMCVDIAEQLRLNPQLQHVYLTYNDQSSSQLNEHTPIPESDIYGKYNLHQFSDADSEPVVKLDRLEVLDLARDPLDMLKNAIDAIQDPILTQLFEVVQNSGGVKRTEAISHILTRIQQLLTHEIDRNFQVSYVARMPQEPDNPNARYTGIRKITPFTQLRRTDSGYFYVETDQDSGSIRTTALSSLLKVSEQPIDDILSTNSQYKRAQLLYIVDQLLRTTPLDDLLKKRPTLAELQDELKKRNIYTHPQIVEETLTLNNKLRKPRVNSLLKMVALTMLLYPAIHLGNESLRRNMRQLIQDKTSSGEIDGSTASPITEEFPTVYPIWHIESTIDTQGKYWIEKVYDLFISHWTDLGGIDDEVLVLPDTIDESTPHVKLTRSMDNWRITQLAIPILEGTQLGAIKVEDQNGELLPIKVKRDSAGTMHVELEIDYSVIRTNVTVTIYLIKSDQPSIATTSNRHEIETNLIEPHYSEVTQRLLDASRQLVIDGSYQTFDEALAHIIRKTFEYGIDKEGNEILKTAKHSDEFVNKAVQLDKMHCNTANTVLAILSENKQRQYATGYGSALVQNSPQGKLQEGFLMSTSKHGFTVDENGLILDATPDVKTPGNEGPTEDFAQAKNAWKDLFPTIESEKDQEDLDNLFKQDTKMIGEILLGLGGIYGAMQISRLLKRHMTVENRDAVIDTAFSSWQGHKQMRIALQFLPYISFGPTDKPFQVRADHEDDPHPLAYLRKSIHHGRISDYVANPEKYEPNDWTKKQRDHQRQIAAFILLHP